MKIELTPEELEAIKEAAYLAGYKDALRGDDPEYPYEEGS